MELIWNTLINAWQLLLDASVFVLFGLVVSGLLRVFLSPHAVVRHFGQGRFRSVFKAALLGIPIPLCSCGVLPAAVAMKKQGANNGATTAFLISTPESGVDSIAVTWALLDPLMTVARPVSAFVTAVAAGIAENLFSYRSGAADPTPPDLKCAVDGCCDGLDCDPETHRNHHSLWEKIRAGLGYAFTDVWQDMAGWFFVGLLLAGAISALVPDDVLIRYLGGGLPAMLLMLVFGIPFYICATASTPIAAALILKGVSPGAALVFLLAGPATNMASLTVLTGVLGKRATAIYLSAIALCSVLLGWSLDAIYSATGMSAQALVGQASEVMPPWAEWIGAVGLLLISGMPAGRRLARWIEETHPLTAKKKIGASATIETPAREKAG
ncbi:MAG: SO_0444 family Cu/Zn efflux transporter [Desulfobacterales bacterium]|nr:SO_0444 family Cu/Zn efflux transporter [Desulfobacterales bacterium]